MMRISNLLSRRVFDPVSDYVITPCICASEQSTRLLVLRALSVFFARRNLDFTLFRRFADSTDPMIWCLFDLSIGEFANP